MGLLSIRNNACRMHGCEKWESAAKRNKPFNYCEMCGFNYKEDDRRKKIPLTMGRDGLQRKIITTYVGDEE